MDRIILEVEDTTARSWRYFSKEERDELAITVNQLVKVAAEKSKEDFKTLLNKIGQEAQANGLTEEILKKLLSER